MNTPMTSEERRNVRKSLGASLAVAFSILFGALALAGVHTPAAEPRVLSLSAATPAAPVAADEISNETVGCGCAESCLVAN